MVKRLFRTVWLGVVLVIGLMSGVTSVGRDALETFYPGVFSHNLLFSFCLRTCFVISVIVVVVKQQFDIAALERDADNKNSIAIIRDSLGEFMVEAQQFMDRPLKSGEEYAQWKSEVDSWFQRCYKFIETKISPADAVLFAHQAAGRYSFSGIVNSEHADYKNSIFKYSENLKELANRLA